MRATVGIGSAIRRQSPPADHDGPPAKYELTRRDFLGLLGAGAGAAAVGTFTARLALAGGGRRPPNFVVIFTDDQGYQDLGCFGSPDIKTPHIDRMAAEGTRFTDFYVASPVCTPSRAALMTGCYPKRVGLHRGVLFPNAKRGLNPDEITMAELLKTRGYATACVGKWHLGDHEKFLPTRQGFDYYYGIPYSNDMGRRVEGRKGVPLMRGEEVIEQPAVQATLTERYTEESVSFIARNRDRPFFLYLPHSMPHVPLHVSPRFKGKSARGLYGDVIECIDWSTGEILGALRKLGLHRDTIVVFTSDNGPWLVKKKHGGSALPLRDGKGTTCEGGMRVPCVMWGPGRIPAGRVSSEVATAMDLFPTFGRLAGAKLPTDRVIDGRDIYPLMRGARGARSPNEAFFYYSRGGRLEAVRAGRWKFRLAGPGRRRKKQQQQQAPVRELYDLEADIGEKTNLAERHPEVAERLASAMKDFDRKLQKTARPVGRV